MNRAVMNSAGPRGARLAGAIRRLENTRLLRVKEQRALTGSRYFAISAVGGWRDVESLSVHVRISDHSGRGYDRDGNDMLEFCDTTPAAVVRAAILAALEIPETLVVRWRRWQRWQRNRLVARRVVAS